MDTISTTVSNRIAELRRVYPPEDRKNVARKQLVENVQKPVDMSTEQTNTKKSELDLVVKRAMSTPARKIDIKIPDINENMVNNIVDILLTNKVIFPD